MTDKQRAFYFKHNHITDDAIRDITDEIINDMLHTFDFGNGSVYGESQDVQDFIAKWSDTIKWNTAEWVHRDN